MKCDQFLLEDSAATYDYYTEKVREWQSFFKDETPRARLHFNKFKNRADALLKDLEQKIFEYHRRPTIRSEDELKATHTTAQTELHEIELTVFMAQLSKGMDLK